jgi:hypothetical protein
VRSMVEGSMRTGRRLPRTPRPLLQLHSQTD